MRSSLVMWKKGSTEDLNPGLWCLTIFELLFSCISQWPRLCLSPAPHAGPAAPWWQGSLSGPPLCVSIPSHRV